MNLHLTLIIVYSIGVVGLGIWTSRYVRTSGAFFVAGRSLGPGLIFASMLAANIGAGTTVGASGIAYRDGISGWWYVGSAGIGSLIFAFTVAPRMWRLAKEHGFYTAGDYLEFRYGPSVRGLATALVAVGSLSLLAGQLIAGATIISVITGAPRWVGSLMGGAPDPGPGGKLGKGKGKRKADGAKAGGQESGLPREVAPAPKPQS